MKYIMIVGDGMADMPVAELNGKTPLGALKPEGLSILAGGKLGRLLSCPKELAPGSDVAFLTILGNDAARLYTGRAALEAAGLGIEIGEGDTALRMNLVTIIDGVMVSHNGSNVCGDEAVELASFVAGLPEFRESRVTPTDSFRHIAVIKGLVEGELTPPHDIAGRRVDGYMPSDARLNAMMRAAGKALSAHPINASRAARGLPPVNGAWFWGAGTTPALENFSARWGLKAAVISAVPLVRGIARLMGVDAPLLPTATGLLDTDYEGKRELALSLLFEEGYDFVLLHVEAPDEMSHEGSLERKLESIRRLDSRVILPLISALDRKGESYRALAISDHYTLLSTRTHDGTPVPYAIYDSRAHSAPGEFSEEACAAKPVLPSGEALLSLFFER